MRKIFMTDENGDEYEVDLPMRWTICNNCEGHGKSSAYLGAYTASEMDEAGPEFEEDYFSGALDRTCECCKGSGKVQVVDVDRLSPEERKVFDDDCEIERQMRAEERMERLMGA